jgi:murein L,D-transpeptidase YcbB/YkuD
MFGAQIQPRLAAAMIATLTRRATLAALLSSALWPLAAMAEQPERNAGYGGVAINTRPAPPTRTEVVEDGSVLPMLTAGSEMHMQRAIGRYEIIVARGGWPRLPQTRILVKDSDDPVVMLLRQRLAAEGYLPYQGGQLSSQFSGEVETALRRFQANHGLYAHGRLDQATADELNVTAAERLKTLIANLPRVQQYSKDLGARYIVVNVPAGQLDAVENGRLRSRHNVIVGKIDRPTPVLQSRISELNFNPYWNAPVSIVEKDILPKVRQNVGILKQLDIKVFDGYGGPEVDPTTIDWTDVAPDRYFFRQEPGEGNAMATVKINFPNPYAVYMHDTPTKQLFTATSRYFSSGCVRVEKVDILVNWLLENRFEWSPAAVKAVEASGERTDVKIADGPQLRFAYLTSWVSDDDQAHFRPDIYNLDGTGFITGQPEGHSEEQSG